MRLNEGPRDFGVLLSRLGDGQALSMLSGDLQRLVAMIEDEALTRQVKISGTLTLKLNVEIDTGGHADVSYTVQVQEPKRERPPTLFFVTKGANLTDEMTKQTRLPLREAPAPRVRDIDDDAAREVT